MNLNRMRRRLRRQREIVRAAWRAWRYRRSLGAPVVADALRFLRKILPLPGAKIRTPLPEWLARGRACRACDLYDPQNRTCGTNEGVLVTHDTIFPNGCSCLVGVKASDPDSICFKASMGLPSGWPTQGAIAEPTTSIEP